MKKIKSTSMWKGWAQSKVTMLFVFFICPIFLPLLSCEPCCPKIVTGHDFRSIEKFVCPDCSDARVHLLYKFQNLKKTDEGLIPCVPNANPNSSVVQMISIKPKKGSLHNPHSPSATHKVNYYTFENPADGYFLTLKPDNLADNNKDIVVSLAIQGENKCQPSNWLYQYVTIKAASRGDNHLLCFPHNDMPSGSAHWMGNADVFGKGVIVTRIVNQNPFPIHVYHAGEEARDLGSGQTSTAHRDTAASGRWVLDIADPIVRAQYSREQKELCVRVFVTCRCP